VTSTVLARIALFAAAVVLAVAFVAVEARVADALRDDLPAADAVVANVTLVAVEALARRLTSRVLVSSGYLSGDRLALPGWRHLERREREGWAADVHERA
jgi:hypothetical protein